MPARTITKGLDDSGKESGSRSKGTIESKIDHAPDINLEQSWDQKSKSKQDENSKSAHSPILECHPDMC